MTEHRVSFVAFPTAAKGYEWEAVVCTCTPGKPLGLRVNREESEVLFHSHLRDVEEAERRRLGIRAIVDMWLNEWTGDTAALVDLRLALSALGVTDAELARHVGTPS